MKKSRKKEEDSLMQDQEEGKFINALAWSLWNICIHFYKRGELEVDDFYKEKKDIYAKALAKSSSLIYSFLQSKLKI